MDIRLKQLSYSSILTTHNCPRKHQLRKLRAKSDKEDIDPNSIQGITFAYGHAVGLGIQLVLEGKTIESVMFQMFLNWKPDLFSRDDKSNKSLWSAYVAVTKFKSAFDCGYLKDYELVVYEGKPACELSFLIYLPNGFVYRGFVDAVLRHKITGTILVLECKTTGMKYVNPAQYKNSAQAIGYSIVLDVLFPGLSSYEVLYQIYKSTVSEWEQMMFSKSYLQRALWIQELLLDIEVLELYERTGVYPMRGESCLSFNRECEFFGTCTMSTQYLTNQITEEEIEAIAAENESYQIKVSVDDLIHAQLNKE